uniref:Rhamnogalacturonan lyase domain-containing protein n=1 Tax=Bactrocera dorsalis TaxID=27457 RepID=A0A034VVX3_BACDO
MRTEMPSQKQCIHLVLLMAFVLSTLVTADYVEIKSTGSSVIGGTVNFSAVLYDDGQVASTGDYMFNWEDNTPAANNVKINTKYPYSNWSVTYPMNTSKPGDYRVTLKVDKNYILWINIATNHIDFKLDDSLGGDMLLLQNDTKPRKNFISTAKPVNHTIQLRPNDAKLIADKAYEVHTYWFRNCTYIGVINGLSYVAQYTEPDQYYKIEALVVASFEKPPEPITTTTTTTTTTTPIQ